jgi:hypothetical protein
MRRPKLEFDLLRECRKMSRLNNVIPPNKIHRDKRYKRGKSIPSEDIDDLKQAK